MNTSDPLDPMLVRQTSSAIGNIRTSCSVWALFLLLISPCFAKRQETSEPSRQEKAVGQVLARHCLECHSGPHPAGDFDLTRPGDAVRGSSGEIDPTDGEFWDKVSSGEMPPKSTLPEPDRQTLLAWAQAGAPWREPPIDPLAMTTAKRAGRDWWSLQPMRAEAPPAVAHGDLVRNPVDAFLLAELERNGLSYAPPVASRDLVRRLYFDLIGLPPTPDVVKAFESNPSDAAYADLVDRLLASPAYGERWARHWLDVVRFGESDGFERNAPREQMWHYRDWVIRSLNEDLPYDEFARRQLIGDRSLADPLEGAAATGYLVAGVHNTVVGSSRTMQLLARQDELEDLVGNIGQTFLGLTFNCARCHDHKFDPITQAEYYQLIADLAGVTHGVRQIRGTQQQREIDRLSGERRRLGAELKRLDDPARSAVLSNRGLSPSQDADLVQPVLRWDFSRGLNDQCRSLKATLQGDARLDSEGLVLNGQADFAVSDPLPLDLREKTLEAWLRLPDINQQGGAAISIETSDGVTFDAIVFGEREPKMWMAGSNGFARTQPFGGSPESTDGTDVVHVAITYSADGHITGYRNGEVYGHGYQTGAATAFSAGASRVLFGLRHSPPGGNKFLQAKLLQAAVYDQALSADEVAASARSQNGFVSETDLVAEMDATTRQQRERLVAETRSVAERLSRLERESLVSVYAHVAAKPDAIHFLPRGDVNQPGDEVVPGATRAISGLNADFGLTVAADDAERRERLAGWITDPENPLFRRVIVNRLWHYHFGRGLVATPSDFGFNGGLPSHPELLDWLASELGRQNFRLKPLHRLMVLSTAYRQSSQVNPAAWQIDSDNRLLWRKSPERLEAEAIRDSLLAVTGKLNSERGGPSFRDVDIVDQGNGTTYYFEIDRDDPQLNRRTIYRLSPRGGRSALLDTLDCPDPSAAAPRRSVTTTPLQALSLLNSPFVLRMSQAFAQRVQLEFPWDTKRQIDAMMELAYGRPASPEELRRGQELVNQHGLPALARAIFNSHEFVVIK